MSLEIAHFQKLEEISSQTFVFLVSRERLAQVDQILYRQPEAYSLIASFYEKSKEANIFKRPKSKEIRDIFDRLTQLSYTWNRRTHLT